MVAIGQRCEGPLTEFGVSTKAGSVRRLSQKTRDLAVRALSGEYGRSMRVADFALDPKGINGRSPDLVYAAVAMAVARNAPLRIVPGERVVGAATLLEATRHMTPLTDYASTSHTTIGFGEVMQIGYRGLRERIRERAARPGLNDRERELLDAMRICLDAASVWHGRHLELLQELSEASTGAEREEYARVAESLRHVPEEAPRSFREAVQSLWFMFAFQRLCGNWSGVGRVDLILGPYLKRDLDEKRVSLDEARELIAHLWIKGCEWAGADGYGAGYSGDAQFFQNVVLGGLDAEGRSVVNEVTYLVLDVVEELHISDYPIAVRIGAGSPDRLLRRIAEVLQCGGGIVAIYNEDIILKSLTRFGYSIEQAREFANDGCWEIIVPARTSFSYWPFDVLRILQDTLSLSGSDAPPDYAEFESLYDAFRRALAAKITEFHAEADKAFTSGPPSPLLSMFVDGCIEKALSYHEGGAHYRVLAPHAGGLPDTANSLLAIKKLVYDERAISLGELVRVLRSDWEGREELRLEARRRFTYYGNDCPEADAMLKRIYDEYVELAGAVKERCGVLRPCGISTFGREIADFLPFRTAAPFGTRKGEFLATNMAPTPGTDYSGPMAVIRSFCTPDYEKLPNGVPLELKIHPSGLDGRKGADALMAIMRTFVALGGVFLHIDVVDTEMLRDAQVNPDRYTNLCVRVSGWSARFATLCPEWQEMIIGRSEQVMR